MSILSRKASIAALYLAPACFLLAVTAAISTTSPLNVGPAGILGIFILFYGLIVSFLFLLAHAASVFTRSVLHKNIRQPRRMYYLASVIAFAPVFMIALNTLGHLGLTETILVIMLVALGCFYVARRAVPSDQ